MQLGTYQVYNPESDAVPYFAPCLIVEDSAGKKLAVCFSAYAPHPLVLPFDESKFKPQSAADNAEV